MSNDCLYRAPYIVLAWCSHMSLNKYDYHIAYASHTTNILNRHKDPTLLYICALTQPSAIHTSHVIAKYVLETNMPTKLSISAICQISYSLHGICISYMCHK